MLAETGRRKIQDISKELRGSKYSYGGDFLMTQGSTALAILITQNQIYIANAGDSKAIVYGLNN